MNDTKLTDDQVDTIIEAMEENKNENDSLKTISDLPSNNGIETSENKESGYEEKVNVTINSDNGVALPCTTDESDDNIGMDFDKLVNEAQKSITEDDLKVDITEDDVVDQISKDTDIFKDMELSRDDTVQLLRIIKRIQNGEKFNIFKSFPIEVQNRLNKYLSSNGLAGYSTEVNTVRNFMAENIMEEFIHNISIDKYTMDFQKEMNELENKVNKEMSKMYMDYSKERENYIRAIISNEDDDTKKEIIGNILDAINEGFTLNRIIELASKIRIKKYDIERPDKIFNIIHSKYNTSTYNIYSIESSCNILARHMKDEYSKEDIIKFFIVICKICMNYNPNNPVEHAFMYYAIYNPILLDVYKGKEYEDFSTEYKKNVRQVIEKIKEREDNIKNGSKNKKGKK